MKTNTTFLLRVSIIASLGGLLFGYDTGVINGAQFYLSKYFDLSATMKGWVVGSALIGCMIGAALAGAISTYLGRKKSLIVSAILFTVSAWGSGLPSFLPQTVPVLVAFRLIGGLGIGIASMNAPMYIGELAPASIRGRLVTWYQMAIVLGFFVVFLATYFISAQNTPEQNLASGWRVMFWSELIPCTLFLGLLFFVPKSPRWLAIVGRDEEAMKVLKKIHGDQHAATELQEIKASLKSSGGVSTAQAFAKPFVGIIAIGTILSVLQQFTGINAVLYYGADIFEKALGFSEDDALKRQLLLAGVNVFCTLIAMRQVDKWGRKPLIMVGAVGMLLGFLLLGGSLMANQVGIVSLVGVLLFIGSFALSMGPVVWVILAEMFPNHIRTLAMTIAVTAQWAGNYFITQTFPIVVDSPANQGTFWSGALPYAIFIAFIIVIVLFTIRFIPETKGRSLEEMEDLWAKKFG